MRTLWDPAAHDALTARINQLTPESRAQWGRMTCPQMIVHVTDAFALYAGELSAAGKRTLLQYAPFKHALVYLVPIPKNVPTAPELMVRVPREWSDEIERLHRAMGSFVSQRARRDWPAHPVFGRLSCRAYGVLAYKHTDHHLRQFGV
jgi:hypothetical protein